MSPTCSTAVSASGASRIAANTFGPLLRSALKSGTHASIQNSDLTKVLDWRGRGQKAIVGGECSYEGNIPNSWGKLTAAEMVHQFWVGTVAVTSVTAKR